MRARGRVGVVHGGDPHDTAPRLVEARAIDDDVDGTHVADLPHVKLGVGRSRVGALGSGEG